MTDIIKSDSQSNEQIQQNILAYLHSLGNWEEIKDNLPASNLTLITQLLSGFASFMNFRHKMERQETYLQQAKQPTSVYEISSTFGYSLNRLASPVFTLVYMEEPTIRIAPGDVLGYYDGDRPLVYFGKSRLIEKLDQIQVHLGEYQRKVVPITFVNDELVVSLEPELLTAIDRNLLRVEVNDIEVTVSRDIENYVVFGDVVDFSPSPTSSRLFLSDRSYSYGRAIAEGDKVVIHYMETNGYEEDLTLILVKPINAFQVVDIESNGSAGDSLEKIRKLAPLLFSALRRMVTARDHTYITEAHPLIRSAYAVRDKGQPLIMTANFEFPFDRDFQITITSSTYTVSGVYGDDDASIQTKFAALIKDPLVEVVHTGAGLMLIQRDARETDLVITASEGVLLNVLEKQEKPHCCTVEINYVKHDTVDYPKPLTAYEQAEMARYFKDYKLVGLTIILRPAQAEFYQFKLNIKLSDLKYEEFVKTEIKKILSGYELTLNKGFTYGEALAKIAQITTVDSNVSVRPIVSMTPNQNPFDVEPQEARYIHFDTIELNIS